MLRTRRAWPNGESQRTKRMAKNKRPKNDYETMFVAKKKKERTKENVAKNTACVLHCVCPIRQDFKPPHLSG